MINIWNSLNLPYSWEVSVSCSFLKLNVIQVRYMYVLAFKRFKQSHTVDKWMNWCHVFFSSPNENEVLRSVYVRRPSVRAFMYIHTSNDNNSYSNIYSNNSNSCTNVYSNDSNSYTNVYVFSVPPPKIRQYEEVEIQPNAGKAEPFL